MSNVLLATESDSIRDKIDAALSDPANKISRVHQGADVLEAIAAVKPDVVILDMQMGSMGGIAATHAIRNEAGSGRIDDVAVIILMDRPDDRWLVRTSGADGWITKPLNSLKVQKAVEAVLVGDTYDDHQLPVS